MMPDSLEWRLGNDLGDLKNLDLLLPGDLEVFLLSPLGEREDRERSHLLRGLGDFLDLLLTLLGLRLDLVPDGHLDLDLADVLEVSLWLC